MTVAKDLKDIKSDIKSLRKWTGRHEKRHGNDADMLGRVLDDLHNHTDNHHGRTTELKRGASIVTILAVLAGLTEVLRQFVL